MNLDTTRYTEAGLTDDEIEYLVNPLGVMDKDQKIIAISIHDKYTKYVRETRDADREARKALPFEERIKGIAFQAEGILRG